MAKLLESITQTDVSTLSYRVTNGLNECMYLGANEPSVGMYRIQEYVQNTVPKVVEWRQNLEQLCDRVNGASFDIEYDTSALKEMSKVSQFSTVSAAIDRAVYLKRQLDQRPPTQAVKRPPIQPPQRQTPPPRNYGTINETSDLTPRVFA